MEQSSSTWIVTAVAILIVPVLVFTLNRKPKRKYKSNIPWAPGALPLIGHALSYRHDPAKFLLDSSKQVGEVFQINLAGKHMIIACGPHIQRIVATAPESILSARQAVADIGFEQTLGYLNVHIGTDLHKGIVKGLWHSNASEHVAALTQSIQSAMQDEVESSLGKKTEFMKLVRRVLLRTTIDQFIGSFFLKDWKIDFITKFMKFQDDLEDVTAKAVVMPRVVALPLFLWPLARRRVALQQKISKRLQETSSLHHESSGFWLSDVKDKHHLDEIAELIVGLLFAAHKNPAIGTAQSYLMLFERASKEHQSLCMEESKHLLQNQTYEQVQERCPTLRRLCFETLRLTAHSIGAVRTARQPFSLGDHFVIPKGATVALTHISSSLNDEFWKDPHSLILDTSSEDRNQDLYSNDYAFSVFSHGVHKCPGQKLALILLQCTVAILLHDYDIELPETIPPLDFERATLAQRGGPIPSFQQDGALKNEWKKWLGRHSFHGRINVLARRAA
eukprot:scaffold2177_cov115-Cylindrotheca_fusiformis.AAC.5